MFNVLIRDRANRADNRNYTYMPIISNCQMEIQPISHVDGYNLFVQHFADNFYHLNIVDPDDRVHHFEGIYSSPQAAIAKGKSVIDNFVFWRAKTA